MGFDLASALAPSFDPYEAIDTTSAVSLDSRIRRLAYLKSPDRIRAAIVNETGLHVSKGRIEQVLMRFRSSRDDSAPEPLEIDQFDYAPRARHWRSLAARELADKQSIERAEAECQRKAAIRAEIQAARDSVAACAAKIPDRAPPSKAIELPLPATGASLVNEVCFELAMERSEFLGPSRRQKYVRARALVVKLLKERDTLRFSYPRIAKIIGRGDHSTAINLERNFDRYCRADPLIYEVYKKLGGRN